jgi:hypothetical protein
MVRGLGINQRRLLGLMADYEVHWAERAAERQERYQPPREWYAPIALVRALVDRGELPDRADHYGDPSAAARPIRALVQRGFVGRRGRTHPVWLTGSGFAEARRLRLVAASNIIDLDQLQERWSGG